MTWHSFWQKLRVLKGIAVACCLKLQEARTCVSYKTALNISFLFVFL